MRFSHRITLVLLLMLACHARHASAQAMQWQDATAFEIEGRGWNNTATPYVRLPDSAQSKVSSLAWDQSRDSSGLAVRFVTDAATVHARWSLTSPALDMPHMAATACSGVDLYARSTQGDWRFIGNGRPGKQDGNVAEFKFPDGAKAGRECLLYLPAYNGTKSLEIGVALGTQLQKAAPRPEKLRQPVVIYGTSITQGACASRPGMTWTAIMGRLLDRPVINLGFSASGTMEPPVGEALAELDPAVYVIDCIRNMGVSQEAYSERITKLVATLRQAHPTTPIIFVGQSHMRPEAHPTTLSLRQENAVRKLQQEGVQGLTLVPGTDLIGDDGEGTVDGVHFNDLGMDRHARIMLPIVRKVLAGKP